MDQDQELTLDVATVWRQERVSCPHPDLLRALLVGSLEPGPREFLEFHLRESQCPFCAATLEDLEVTEDDAAAAGLQELRDRLMRSTVAALRQHGERA